MHTLSALKFVYLEIPLCFNVGSSFQIKKQRHAAVNVKTSSYQEWKEILIRVFYFGKSLKWGALRSGILTNIFGEILVSRLNCDQLGIGGIMLIVVPILAVESPNAFSVSRTTCLGANCSQQRAARNFSVARKVWIQYTGCYEISVARGYERANDITWYFYFLFFSWIIEYKA